MSSIIDYAIRGNFNNFNNKLNIVSKETGISKPKLLKDFIKCFALIGSGYSDFLNYKLYLRSDAEIKEYATIKTQNYFYEIVSPSKYKTAFTIKPNFLKNFKKYCPRDSFNMGSKEELISFLNRNEKIMYKPVDGLGGESVKSIRVADINNLDAFYEEITNKNILLEGYVKQHSEMAKFAPNSVNTLRIMTFGYEGKSTILAVIMRIGNGIADVDNFHQGGMGVAVDIESGKLIGKAIDKDNKEYEVHPFSGYKFDGFQIPNWDIVKKTVLEAALVNEHIHVVGWDVAVTEDGCTFIEGNRRPGFDLPQVAFDRGRKDIMRYCLDIINKNEGTSYKV